MNYYYINDAGDVTGPVSISALKELKNCGSLHDDTLICVEGAESWSKLGNLPSINTDDSSSQTPTDPINHQIPEVKSTAEDQPFRKTRFKTKLIITGSVAFIIVSLSIAFLVKDKNVFTTSAGQLPDLSRPLPEGFSLIPEGSFMMGDALDHIEHAPQHRVTLSAFYIGKHEVTQALWDRVWLWAKSNGYTSLTWCKQGGKNLPAYEVSWYDILKWCNAYSEMEGLQPCYFLSGEIYRIGEPQDLETTMISCDFTTNGYRLPTEAEWEKAARGGLEGLRFPWGNTINHWKANYTAIFHTYLYQEEITLEQYNDPDLSDSRRHDYMRIVSNLSGGSRNSITGEPRLFKHDKTSGEPYLLPVGSFAPNGYGLYDMAGNASEWCWDSFKEEFYLNSPELNPTGFKYPPSEESKFNIIASASCRVARGGRGGSHASRCRVASRSGYSTTVRHNGFRLVCR